MNRLDTKAKNVDHQENDQTSFPLNLTKLSVPFNVLHVKTGHTLCANRKLLVIQDGPTTLEIFKLPELTMTRIPWNFGMMRDLIWSDDLNMFLVLMRNSLRNINLGVFDGPTVSSSDKNSTAGKEYTNVKPFGDEGAFWRCTCAQKTIFITYTGRI